MSKKTLLFIAFEGVIAPSFVSNCACNSRKTVVLDDIFYHICDEMVSFLNRLGARDDIEVVWNTEVGHPVEDLHEISNIPQFRALESPRLSKTPNRIVKASESFENVIVVDPRECIGVGVRTLVQDSEKFLMIRTDRNRGLCGSGHLKLLERFLDFKMFVVPAWTPEAWDTRPEMAEIGATA